MPSNRNETTPYPMLEHLSIEELENLLAQDFIASNGEEPDVEYIMAIMEVIEKKEAVPPEVIKAETEAAWKDFQENYMGQAAAYDIGDDRERDSSHLNQIESTVKSKKPVRRLKFALVIAAVLVLLCGTTVFGFNIFQAFVEWSSETFHFVSKVDEDEKLDVEPLDSLRTAVASKTNILVIPNWSPNGCEMDGDIHVVERENRTKMQGLFHFENGSFTILVEIYDSLPEDFVLEYEKNAGEELKYTVNGLKHSITTNNGNNIVAWSNENVVCMIQGDLTVEELKQMVDSIYEE